MSALQLASDIWTQFQGDQVAGLLVQRGRLDYRRRISTYWLKIETPIECVSISDEYLGEFTVKVQFAAAEHVVMDLNDAMLLRMADGWQCAGRFISQDGKLLVMMCPVATENGMPREMTRLAPSQRPLGLPAGRKGWMR